MPLATEHKLLGFYALAAGQPEGDPPRSRVQLMQAGKFSHPRFGKFEITQQDLEGFAASIRDQVAADGNSAASIDYDHAFAERGDSRAAGWITPNTVEVQDGALFATVEWTATAAAAIRDREYRFISPEFSFVARDRATGEKTRRPTFHAATLTNRPFLRDMQPVTLSERGLADLLSSRPLSLTADETARVEAQYGDATTLLLRCASADDPELAREATELITNSLKEISMPFDLKAVAGALQLSDDADEATVLAAIKANADKAAKTDDLEAKVADLEKQAVPADTLATLTASAAKGEEAAKRLHEMERDTLLASAVDQGKILPVQKDAFVAMFDANPQHVRDLLEATPAKSYAAKGNGNSAPDGVVVAASTRGEFASEWKVDEESLTLHAKATALLAADGKHTPTEDEYLAAVARAQSAA